MRKAASSSPVRSNALVKIECACIILCVNVGVSLPIFTALFYSGDGGCV